MPATWLWALGAASVAFLVGSLLALPVLVARLPSDFFTGEPPRRPWWSHLWRKALGGLLVALGVAMLVLPGQGLLTIALGLACLELPGHHRALRWLVRRPGVTAALQSWRVRLGAPPLQL